MSNNDGGIKLKKFIVLFVVLFIFFIPSLFAFQNEPDGFRDLKWGDNINEILNKNEFIFLPGAAEKLTTDRNMTMYGKMHENYSVGDGKVWAIQYFFWKNQFCYAVLLASTSIDYYHICTALETKFGQPTGKSLHTVSDILTQEYWEGQKTRISLTHTTVDDSTQLIFSSVEIKKQIAADEVNTPVNIQGL